MPKYNLEYGGSNPGSLDFSSIEALETTLKKRDFRGDLSLESRGYELSYGKRTDILSAVRLAREYGCWSLPDGTELKI